MRRVLGCGLVPERPLEASGSMQVQSSHSRESADQVSKPRQWIGEAVTQTCQELMWGKYNYYACPKPAKFYYVRRGKPVYVCGVHRRSLERHHEMHPMDASPVSAGGSQ